MIKFFRRIRQKLLSENKFSKYLVYAFGEIILVVIGILIALQINNWNEDRKSEIKEIQILSNLKTELEKTLIEFEAAVSFNQSTIVEINKLQYYHLKGLPYSDELEYSFGVFPHFYFSSSINSTYRSLQVNGLDIIKNDSLKNKIINVYDVVLDDFKDYNDDENRLKATIVDPFFSKNISYLDNSVYRAIPNDYNQLINDREFLNILSLIKRQRNRGLERYSRIGQILLDLIESISIELDIRD